MKIKFDVKSTKASLHPLYVIYMEQKGEDDVELKITKFNLKQLKFGEQVSMEEEHIPITDGILRMSKANLKRFIAAATILTKN